MTTLASQRCLNHGLREAAARCPECRQCYCRECITEHEDRVICAACLKKLVASAPFERSGLRRMVRWLQCAGGVAILWLFFFLLGQALLALPGSFHEGTIWKGGR